MAWVCLVQSLGAESIKWAEKYLPDLSNEEREIITAQLDKKQGYLMTSSCGRLFDAVSALLGVCSVNDYEGQGAALLEAQAKRAARQKGYYPYEISCPDGSVMEMSIKPMWAEMMAERRDYAEITDVAAKFHNTLTRLFTRALTLLRENTGINRVVLSGGVFHNQILLFSIYNSLEQLGFQVYYHQLAPAGDGSLSLGQAAIANEVMKKCV